MPRLIKPSAKIICATPNMLDVIENAARKCYLSEPKKVATEDHTESAWSSRREEQATFLRSKIALGHHSILEHGNITMEFVFDRGVSHEEVRHRIQAISQESTRYCNYSKEKFGNEIAVIDPYFFDKDDPQVNMVDMQGEEIMGNKFWVWLSAMHCAEYHYLQLLKMGATAQEARSVLPNSLKTEMTVTQNVRELRHMTKIRTEAGVHPQMAEVMVPFLRDLKLQPWGLLFEDINHDPKWDFFLNDPCDGCSEAPVDCPGLPSCNLEKNTL